MPNLLTGGTVYGLVLNVVLLIVMMMMVCVWMVAVVVAHQIVLMSVLLGDGDMG